MISSCRWNRPNLNIEHDSQHIYLYIVNYNKIKYNHFTSQKMCLHLHHKGMWVATAVLEVIEFIFSFTGTTIQVFNISIPALWFLFTIWTVAAKSTGIFCAQLRRISSSPLSATLVAMFMSTLSTTSSVSRSHSRLPPSFSAITLNLSSLFYISPPSIAFTLSTWSVPPSSPYYPSPPVSPSWEYPTKDADYSEFDYYPSSSTDSSSTPAPS